MTGAISQQQGNNNPKDTLQSAYMVQTEESQYELSPKGYSAVFGSNHNASTSRRDRDLLYAQREWFQLVERGEPSVRGMMTVQSILHGKPDK